MENAKFVLAAVLLLCLAIEVADGQTCTFMWNPIFETNPVNPPAMCPVNTTSGSPCHFPFNYGGVTYKTCTVQGPNNEAARPQCATTVNSNNTAMTWSVCIVPNDAVVSYATVRKDGYPSQNSGSTQGGTLIWIYGQRFAQNGFTSSPSVSNTNTVQLVDGFAVYTCEMHNDKVTSTQLTCYAPVLPESVYQIRVYVNGLLIPLYQYQNPARALFIPLPSQTPTITGITPQSGPPQSMIQMAGSFKTSCYSRDIEGCSQDNNPLISRIFVGGHLCNLIDPMTGTVYGNVTDSLLQCNFEGSEVGIFNTSMLISNEFGRALVSPSLYRVSGNEDLYTFQSYAVVNNVSPNTGSTVGGTTLTITGNFFSDSSNYPLVVKVGGQPCTILSSDGSTIKCQTPVAPTSTPARFQGGRGLQLYRTTGSTSQATLSNANPPSPPSNATSSWTDDASILSNTTVPETSWLIGYVRVPKTATYTFSVETNGAAALFLSTDDNPANKVLIADPTNNQSAPQSLQNSTNYYLYCIGSRANGNLRVNVQARLHETKLTSGASSLVQNEIQRIDVVATVAAERQQIAYTTTAVNGTSEVQSLLVDVSTFQIGFRGVYTGIQTGRPTASTIQSALNDLPTIYPSSVSVSATSTLYVITFPTEMGDVPLLTCISNSVNQPNVTEVTPGLASGAKIAFALDGQLTDYIDFVTTNATQADLQTQINNLFSIQCPPSLNNPTASRDIVYAQDYESNCVFDSTPIRTNAFCGQCSSNGNSLVNGNTLVGNVICFAYRLTNNYVISIGIDVQINGDPSDIWSEIPFTPKADQLWHYTCIDVQATLISQSTIDVTASALIIRYAWLNNNVKKGIFLDTVTIRSALPIGYEYANSYPVDQSANSSCVFPFNYNGQTYSACTLDNNGIPICADNLNRTVQCRSSSIEGVRRLYPKHQLVYNTLQVTYSPSTPTITVAFRYSDCAVPTLFTSWPTSSTTITRLTAASRAASGTFDLVFGGQTYSAIPVDISTADLAVRLQSSPQFGFLNIVRSRDCTGYSYTIEWVANGGAKTAISITNAGSVTPVGTTVNAVRVQPGGAVFKPLSGDMTRTYQTNPQVEVFVGGFPSQCTTPGACNFQWLPAQTPSVTLISQSGSTLTITGTGFSTIPSANAVIIGGSGSCTVTTASASSLTCTISAAPAGNYSIQVNVDGKGLAASTSTFYAIVSLQVTSISPSQGGAGGGYQLTIVGSGFSSSSVVTVDNSACTNSVVSNFTSITCTVPASSVVSNTAVSVVVNSGTSSVTAPIQFTYNVANTPTIGSTVPNFLTVAGGTLTITGTNFGTGSITVSIGTTGATVRSSSPTQIVAILPALAPGIYPLSVMTSNGRARPERSIEYRLYVQNISPRVGSIYGGSDVYVQGEGFDSSTTVSFTDGSSSVACQVVSFQSNQIYCQTAPAAPRVIISSNGVDPTYGTGFAWTPQFATVQQGAVVEWQWGGSDLLSSLNYKVQEVATGSSTTPLAGGFDSGNGTATGSFSYQFQTVGTHYYWAPAVDQSGLISMRGVINVVAVQSRTLAVNVVSRSFTAQSCAFPFVFNSNSYTACTTDNDTQLWCSPTAAYNGQRLYCTATASVPVPSCVSSSLISPVACSQTVPSNVLQFLFTECTVGTVTGILPARGPSGTSITISGTGFSTTPCENTILIGGSYQCPIQSATATQLICQVGSNSSLSPRTVQNVLVNQVRRGSLSTDGLLQFQFQAQITSVAPLRGSTAGGTEVVINGDGFTPADTRVAIGSIEYTSTAIITYTQIRIRTDVPPTSYINQVRPIIVSVGSTSALCSSGSCTFTWAQSATPALNAVSPSSITGPQTLTLTGQNFDVTGSITAASVHVSISGQACNVTAVTNSTITCQTGSLPAGNFSIVVSIDGVGSVVSSPILTSSAAISSISPTSGGINGGVLLTINGNGFGRSASEVQVNIGSGVCAIVQATPGQVQCTVPAQGSNTSPALLRVVSNGVVFPNPPSFTYSSGATPNISSISPTTGGSGQALTISGSNFVSGQTTVTVGGTTCAIATVSASSITCTVGAGPAGSQPVVVSVASVGTSNTNTAFIYNLQITSASPAEGSFGGGQTVTIVGDGFNSSSPSVTICGQACRSVSALSNSQLTCVTPSAASSPPSQQCTLTVSAGGLSQNTVFTYRANLTATVTSISPMRGGTGGGTSLTINGTNFPTSNSAVTVSVAGVPCTVQSSSATTITCSTGAFNGTTVQAPVIVNLVNGGNAIGSVQFQYIDLWSSPWTWGGGPPPEQGTIVSIDSGKTVYFDTTTPVLKALVIDNATLIFDDSQDVALNVEYILVVNGGRLQVGTESLPFQHQAVITMYGHLRSIELPIFGAKVLALRDGTVDLHGRSVVRTWTRLASTATPGTSNITLIQDVDWTVGSRIVIATTGNYLSQGETETRTITAISSNGRVLTLDSPLTFSHLGVTQQVGSTSVDARAEVGLLSHNVIFQGSVDSSWNTTIQACPTGFNPGEFAVQTCFLGRYGQEMGSDQFGATIMASGSMDNINGTQRVILRLSNIEVFNAGQAFRLGRYPVHFHMNGNMSSSYIKSSSIHQTFNRAVNIHASHFVTLENNVIHNVMGGALFLEDGVEIGNVLRGNLAVFVRSSSSLLNEDVTPAAFWVTNPNNIVENNAVAGGTHFGYWYRMLRTPDGPSFATYPNFCPYRQQFGRFSNNTVHSVGRFGVWIFPEYSPTTGSSCWGDSPFQAVFDGLISWRNNRGFEWVMSSSIQIRNALVFDNQDTGLRCVTAINNQATDLPNLRATFYNENTGSSVINSIVIGDSGLPGGPVVPGEGGLVVMWDRGLRVRNVSFINFPSPNTQAIFGPVINGRCIVFCGGWATRFSQLSFSNVLNRGNFRWAYDGLYVDEDGTLANSPGSVILPPDGLWNGSSACSVTPNFVNAITCPGALGTWTRFAFNGASLSPNGEMLHIYDTSNHHTVVPFLAKRLTHPKGYMMNLLARRTYFLQFQNANSSVNLSYSGVAYNLAPGDFLIINHSISYMPDRVFTTSRSQLASLSSGPLSAFSNNGDWYYDNTTNTFSFIMINPSSNTLTTDVTITLNVVKCRYPNCESPAQPGLELPAVARPSTALFWSNDSHWSFVTNGFVTSATSKPAVDSDIFIPRGIWMVIDYPLPRMRSLRIDGVLEFEQGINNTLAAESILINGGQLIAGWPNNPLTSNVDIVITGSSSVNVLLPSNAGTVGPRVLGVLGGLDLHGIPRNVTWTRIAATAAAGQNIITLSEPVDWVVGDEIVITTTDTRLNHAERHTIASINIPRTAITLVNNLAYSHVVIQNTFPNGQVFRVAAAVGLLTRNVRVINRSPASELFGFRILVTDYSADVWNPVANESFITYYKGYARLSNAQFIGYGQFVDAADEDKREGIHLYNLGDWNASRPTYIDSCSFDGGYYSAIGVWDTNGVPITNNVIYNTYESALVVAGQNNIVQKNLVSTVYWSGTAQPQYAEFNINNDGAIMSKKAISVVMRDNLVSGAERLAYRIQGNACPGTVVSSNITNDYDNNEAHSSLSGVNIWPMDKGFDFDPDCILIKGFKTYKTYFYGLYINTARNIIIDSCAVAESAVGIFPFVMGPAGLSHVAEESTIVVRNSMVIGAITPNDCSDVRDTTSVSAQFGITAVPRVAPAAANGEPSARTGISFPYFSGDNMMPRHQYTCVSSYPCIKGLMTITNVTFGFFNDVCSRRDAAIRVSQNNDDGQHPVKTDNIYYYNSSVANIIFNGRPNIDAVNPSDCVDMDCDGLKKALLTDTDGSLFGQPSTVFSQAEYLWGDQAHGVGDFRIPSVALANLTGQMININVNYPQRGIARASSCVYQPSWQMYYCPNNTDYRMLIIENMDSDTETRRLSPVAIMPNGYIDLINGPQDHGWCNGYTCQKRLSTFMAVVQTRQHTDIFLTSTTPDHMRFRLLNADSSVVATLGLYYTSLQQVDVYANDIYVPPTNRDLAFTSYLMLVDRASNVTLNSAPGANYFNRTTQMATFVIRGDTVIDLKISELIVLTFGLPAVTPAGFFGPALLTNLAALLGVSADNIRRVNIISAGNDTRIRRQSTTYQLRVEIRSDPPRNLSTANDTAIRDVYNMNAAIINSYQSGELLARWAALAASGGVVPFSLNVQEPLNQTSVPLSIISRVALVTSPSSCREQSACNVQPVLVAYDVSGNVIQKLGSNDQPWQVVASVVGQPSIILLGATANYSDGRTQYSTFGVPVQGSYQIAFRFVAPNGVSSTFVFNTSLEANSTSISVTDAILAAKQHGNVDVVSVNELFSLSLIIVDKASDIQVGHIQWGNFTWSASVSLYGLLQYASNGSLINPSSSLIVVDTTAGTITANNLSINDTGMYIVKVQLTSSNNLYNIQLTSSGILVKESSTVLEVDSGFPTSYITFAGDFDALKASGQLENTRASIYNYLMKIKMPISSNLVLTKGSVLASFLYSPGSAATLASAAATLATSGSSAVSNLPMSGFVLNGKSYTVNSGSSSGSSSGSGSGSGSGSQSSSQAQSSTGLIVGLVLGLVGAAVFVVLAVVSYKKYQTNKRGRKLCNEPDIERTTMAPTAPVDDSSDLTSTAFTRLPSAVQTDVNRVHSPLPMEMNEPRAPSATLSVSMMDQLNGHKKPVSSVSMPAVELIKFD